MSYVELHAHSYYSLLDGASSPSDLVQQAVALGMTALALTDHDAVYGIPAFVQAARKAGIKPIIGAELTLHDRSHLTLLVQNMTGWRNLCALITAARHNAPKGEARLPEDGLIGFTDGLIALSGCRSGQISAALGQGNLRAALQYTFDFIQLFGREHFWIELQHHQRPQDNWLNAELADLADSFGVGIVATNNVHYATRSGHSLQDVLVCIREKTSLDEAQHLRPNSEYHLKSADDMAVLFRDYPDALANTCRIAEVCTFDLPDGLQALPVYPTP
ncbi:MAG: PHP domain-containing protein, partial [Anaerolineae bacterium]|nr:PHP domain-containing protein [Anaerolineae bacterium]